jgi:hypothetical protein
VARLVAAVVDGAFGCALGGDDGVLKRVAAESLSQYGFLMRSSIMYVAKA